MNKIIASKPIQAGDYGKNMPLTPFNQQKRQSDAGMPQTDGQKTLSLWAR